MMGSIPWVEKGEEEEKERKCTGREGKRREKRGENKMSELYRKQTQGEGKLSPCTGKCRYKVKSEG